MPAADTSNSPWIHQLNRTRPVHALERDTESDIAIIGAGISGLATAYFVLRFTNFRVILVEADKVAHGATGHNAGQIVSYFERQVSDLAREYGLELTAQAQRAVDSAWGLLDDIYAHTGLKTPFATFTGYAGCQDLQEVLLHLDNSVYCQEAGLPIEPVFISETYSDLSLIPEKYSSFYTLIPHSEILEKLETENTKFVALVTGKKGCMNSALFCEDLLHFLFTEYADRFRLVEHSPVSNIRLEKDYAVLSIKKSYLSAKKVVLCTNGFERFTITNAVGPDIDKKFHHLVRGTVGYMAAYLEPRVRAPIAISYLPNRAFLQQDAKADDPYFYLTRRDFELSGDNTQSLVCIGGPEALMDDSNNYRKEHPYPEEAQEQIDTFLHESFKHAPQEEISYHYKWHGLMGYTPNGLRCIGPEPLNPVLLYNLGCNGIGILPSIYGGKKISQFLAGEDLPPSIFDPQAGFVGEYSKKKYESFAQELVQRALISFGI